MRQRVRQVGSPAGMAQVQTLAHAFVVATRVALEGSRAGMRIEAVQADMHPDAHDSRDKVQVEEAHAEMDPGAKCQGLRAEEHMHSRTSSAHTIQAILQRRRSSGDYAYHIGAMQTGTDMQARAEFECFTGYHPLGLGKGRFCRSSSVWYSCHACILRNSPWACMLLVPLSVISSRCPI